jgi:hypothetical protein
MPQRNILRSDRSPVAHSMRMVCSRQVLIGGFQQLHALLSQHVESPRCRLVPGVPSLLRLACRSHTGTVRLSHGVHGRARPPFRRLQVRRLPNRTILGRPERKRVYGVPRRQVREHDTGHVRSRGVRALQGGGVQQCIQGVRVPAVCPWVIQRYARSNQLHCVCSGEVCPEPVVVLVHSLCSWLSRPFERG